LCGTTSMLEDSMPRKICKVECRWYMYGKIRSKIWGARSWKKSLWIMMVATCKIDLKSKTIAGGKEGGEDYPSRYGLCLHFFDISTFKTSWYPRLFFILSTKFAIYWVSREPQKKEIIWNQWHDNRTYVLWCASPAG
jgi:hypothetical protein